MSNETLNADSFYKLIEEKYASKGYKAEKEYEINSKIFRVGQRLKLLRERENLSLEDISEKTGLEIIDIRGLESGSGIALITIFKYCELGLQLPLHLVVGNIIE